MIGRRQRIAYIDRNGVVQDTSYHHRIDKWSPFPSKKMWECGSCHFTAFGSGPIRNNSVAVAGRWVEMNIGCEACHGPGGQHVQSLNKEDITVNASSRLCGGCHTTVGKVLPVDDQQDMHDLVQVWNHDRHITGTQFQSHNAFCARCHSPFQGSFDESAESAKRRVFTEHKHNITCIGCHNPHELTNDHYARPQISLEPPLLPRLHTYQGDDGDFTTTDFDEFETVEKVCVRCHRGADRVDLDHANATCGDCHNSFKRNRSLESRVFHDANRLDLSCRSCHRDADHLITILFRDPDFLQPKYIHNLRTLPAAIKAKHGFRFTELGYSGSGDETGPGYASGYEQASETVASAASTDTSEREETTTARVSRQRDALRTLLAKERHQQIAQDNVVRQRQAVLRDSPERLAVYLALAVEYATRGDRVAARQVIELGLHADAPRMLLELPLDNEIQSSPAVVTLHQDPRELTDVLFGNTQDRETTTLRLWTEAYLEMTQGHFGKAADKLARARALDPNDPSITIHLAMAELGRQRYESALAMLESVLATDPDHVTARLAIGWLQLQRRRFVPARREIEQVLATEPGNSVASYLLGRGYLNHGDPERAAVALAASVAADPSLLQAWFQLARSFRTAGRLNASIRVYEEIVTLQPGWFEARFELASLLKLASDSTAFQLQSEREKARPPGTAADVWQEYLTSLEHSSRNYAQLALSEFALALGLRPADLESVHQVSNIYRRSGRLTQARKYLDWLSHREPDAWQHFYRLGTVLLELERPDDAIRSLKRAIDLAPAEGDTYFALGLAYVRANRFDEAVKTFHQGTVYEPFNPALYMNLGAAYASTGEYALARGALHRSLELASFPLPRLHLIYTNLALVHLSEGREADAVKALKNALHVFPGYEYARTLLDGIASQTGQHIAAQSYRDAFVFNDFLERFGEVTTVAFDNE